MACLSCRRKRGGLRGAFTSVIITAPGNSDADIGLPSNSVIGLGKNSEVSCSRKCKISDHVIGVRNRKCFRIGGSDAGPFVIGSTGVVIGILNAGFGFYSCPGRARTLITLSRNGIGVAYVRSGRRVALLPGRRIIFSGGANTVALLSAGALTGGYR